MDAELLSAEFIRHFGHTPLLVRAPGRVNLIGEHTDYNLGFVMPGAINRAVYFAIALNQRQDARLIAYDEQQDRLTITLSSITVGEKQWANYLLGVIAQFQQRGLQVPGFDCIFGGDIPLGAGLSSSAALCCGLAFALNHLLKSGLDRLTLAQIAQGAEHAYAGVRTGLMDQFASLFGQAGHVVRLDCRSLVYDYFPFDTASSHIVLCNSGVKHSLASSEYNTRRYECEQGVAILKQRYPEVASLRDVTLAQLQALGHELGPVVYKRCRYVVEENQRVEAATQALNNGDLDAVGLLMYASHAGLRDEYEVSCRELDVLVEAAQSLPGVFGARMMGGGFGGCTINLVAPEHVPAFEKAMKEAYQRELGLPLETYHTVLVDGVSLVDLDSLA
ncbi:galactokinase [Hymenobacter wooponensis]|uniref:Galactokinase n=1 Tax=Hymenobacter wooponensis TaxID=1525360 RepID=A0A4Z0MCH1_9BACT|nr:galactokinase [Hymenobacter wooponensis]TGD77186.1 galactokinase [Hymenobacter wooponensis]